MCNRKNQNIFEHEKISTVPAFTGFVNALWL